MNSVWQEAFIAVLAALVNGNDDTPEEAAQVARQAALIADAAEAEADRRNQTVEVG